MSSTKKVIKPKYLNGYIYDVDLSNNECVVVKIKIPTDLSRDDINVKNNKNTDAVVVGVKDEIPFISGICFGKISDFKYTFAQGLITLTLTKEDPSITWPIVIKAPISKKNNLDPLSALTLGIQYLMSGNEADGQQLIAYSADCMFPPAIIQYATFMAQSRVSCDPLIPLLFRCVDEYRFAPAGTLIGNLSIFGQISFDTAFPYVKKSATELNDPNAKFLYSCFLSPLETPHGRFEDADEAFKVLGEIEGDNPLARFGLARLYREGVGCEKDESKANQLLESARKESPDVPTFEEIDQLEKQQEVKQTPPKQVQNPKQNQPKKEESGSILSKVVIAGTACAFAVATGYTLYRRFIRS